MKLLRVCLVCRVISALLIESPTLALATTDQSDAAAPIVALNGALLTTMKSAKSTNFSDRMKALGPPIEAAFDLSGILRAVVGHAWMTLPPSQQQQLSDAFRDFTIASYVANFDGYDNQQFDVSPTSRSVGGDQIVATKIISSKSSNEIDYQMRQVDGVWKARDVLLDGTISNVAKQYSDFHELLQAGDAHKLIDALRRKAAELESGSAQ